MKKKACIVDVDVVYKGRLTDTNWLLIYFTILWAFYLFE